MSELIAENLTSNLSSVSNYENSFKHGETGEFHLYLKELLSQDQIDAIKYELLSQGIIILGIEQDAGKLIISFQK